MRSGSIIFDGLAVESTQPAQIRYVPGEQVGLAYPGEVTLKIASADVGMLHARTEPGANPCASSGPYWVARAYGSPRAADM